MKNRILATASALALTVAVSGAHAADAVVPPEYFAPAPVSQTSGNVGLWLGGFFPSNYFDEDCCNDSFEVPAYGFGGDARGIHEFSPGNALQLEFRGLGHTDMKAGTGSGDDKVGSMFLMGGAHWINRTPNGAWGIFGGITHEIHAEEEGEGSGVAFLGAEVARHIANTTIYGQVGGLTRIFQYDDGSEVWARGVFGRVGARHFFTENRKLEGSLAAGGGVTIDADTPSDKDPLFWFQAAAEFEQKSMNGPFSWFIGYQGDYVAVDEPGGGFKESVWVHTAKIGVRMVIGQPTLLAQDHLGVGTFTFVPIEAPLMYGDELD